MWLLERELQDNKTNFWIVDQLTCTKWKILHVQVYMCMYKWKFWTLLGTSQRFTLVRPHRCLSLQFWIVPGLCLDRFIGLGHNPTRHQNCCPHRTFFRDLTICESNSDDSDGILILLNTYSKLAYPRTGLTLCMWDYAETVQLGSNQFGLDHLSPKWHIQSKHLGLDDGQIVVMTREGAWKLKKYGLWPKKSSKMNCPSICADALFCCETAAIAAVAGLGQLLVGQTIDFSLPRLQLTLRRNRSLLAALSVVCVARLSSKILAVSSLYGALSSKHA